MYNPVLVLSKLDIKLRSRIGIDPKTGCWNWTGRLNRNGYGQVYMNGQYQMVHRVVYRKFRGNIGDKELDHICCNRRCCNPAHLEPVTTKENLKRRDRRMRNGKFKNVSSKSRTL